MADRLGFVGLGVMGGPMAGHLIAAGNDLVVWNRTPGKCARVCDLGAKIADSLEDLAAQCDAILLCVSRSEHVQECLAQLTKTAQPGTLFIDHSTIAPPVATHIHADLKSKGLRFIDAPVTGGSMGAQNGTLTIFLGGEEADVKEAIGIIEPFTKRAERVGGPGCGQMAKMANQIAGAGALIGLCESLSFAKKAGLDTAQIRSLLQGGAAGSWAFTNYGDKILNADWSPGFTIANQRKDFGYADQAAKEIGAAIPCTLLVDQILAKLDEKGHGDWTTAALYEEMLQMGSAG